MPSFADIFAGRPVLADGAMGTVLDSRGVPISRCYDELNLSDPALILAIHEEYLQAGAEILETNTFGANRFRLARHGLASKVADINAAGVRIARQAVSHLREKQAGGASIAGWIAGSVGPLGVRLEPLGKTGLDEARSAFAEQIRALAAGGVDFLSIETMPALNEAREAKAVGAEGVGFKNLRASLQIFLVNGEDQRRIGEIELVVAAADGHAAAIEHCAHGAVGEKGTTSEDVGERGHPVVMLRQPGGARQQTGLLCYTSGVKSGIASDSGRCAKRSAMRKSRSRSSRHGCGELRAKPSR